MFTNQHDIANPETDIMRLMERVSPATSAQLRARPDFVAAFAEFVQHFGRHCNLSQQTSREICAEIISKRSATWINFVEYLASHERTYPKQPQRQLPSKLDTAVSTLGMLATILPIIAALLYCVRETIGAPTPLNSDGIEVVCAVVGILGACLGRFVGIHLRRCTRALGERCNKLAATVYYACSSTMTCDHPAFHPDEASTEEGTELNGAPAHGDIDPEALGNLGGAGRLGETPQSQDKASASEGSSGERE